MMWILTQKMLGAQGLGEQLLASSCWLETGKLRFEEGLGRARIHRLRKNALERRSREGHDVQSCHKSSNMNVGFSRWGTLSIQTSLFPQPVQPCREMVRIRARLQPCRSRRKKTGFSPCGTTSVSYPG